MMVDYFIMNGMNFRWIFSPVQNCVDAGGADERSHCSSFFWTGLFTLTFVCRAILSGWAYTANA